MGVVAEKTIDASGSLTRSGDDPSLVNTGAGQGPGTQELDGHNVEDVPCVGTKPSETFIYWESRGGLYIVQFPLILNTAARELDERCTDLRNNLLSSGRVLDEQQATIVSKILNLVSRVWLKTDRII